MGSSSRANARNNPGFRSDGIRNRADGLDQFAGWVESLMRRQGYDIDSPRGGGKSKLADDAGVHRAAVSRLLQRQSMPDLETMRRLAGVLGIPLREMLIRSGRLSEEDLPIAGRQQADPTGAEAAEHSPRLSPEEAARRMGVLPELREVFVKVAKQFLPAGS
jgi:transcriptional regulator with XRE-family HTH domain